MTLIDQFQTFLDTSIRGAHAAVWIGIVEAIAIAAVAVASYYAMRVAETIIMIFVEKTPTKWDDDMLNKRSLKAFSQLMPALVVAWLMPKFYHTHDMTYNWVSILTASYILWVSVYIVSVYIDNLYHAFARRKRFRPYAVKGIFQMARLILLLLAIIINISLIMGRSPLSILMAMGASAAILMLVFKDTILGLVASVQLTANKMLHKGDWIIVDSHGANGEVIDISLTTVKVRNWDNSVTTIPPYSLVSESFKNYQPMRRSGGRRVDRSILINANSVRFLTPDELETLEAEGWLEGVARDQAKQEINLQLLRRYLERYLSTDPRVRHDMLLMVRQMEPTATGLPLQLYFFTDEVRWKEFEQIQSDIFDHVYAIVNRFGLSIYQIASTPL